MKDYLTEILNRVRTVNERADFLHELSEAKNGLYLTGKKADEYKKRLSPWMSKFVADNRDLRELESIQDWPVLSIVTSQALNESGLDLVSEWVRKHVDNKIILATRVDRSLGAGPVFEYLGRIKDYSIKANISKYGI